MSERDRLSTTANTGDICCPFFIAHSKKEIMCEGLVEGCRMHSEFAEAEEKTAHQKIYCENNYKRCEMYCSIRHWKWPEEDD